MEDTCNQIAMILADLGYEPPRYREAHTTAFPKLLCALLDLQRRVQS